MIELAEKLDGVASNLMFTSWLIQNGQFKFPTEEEREYIKSLLTVEMPSARLLRLKGFPYSILDLNEDQLNEYKEDVEKELRTLEYKLTTENNRLYDKRVMIGVIKKRRRRKS